MAKVKVSLHIVLPSPKSNPPPPPLIPTSVVTLKSTPSTPPPIPFSALVKKLAPSAPPSSFSPPSAPPSSFPPPSKKPCPSPFIKGQVGRKFFSLSQPRSYTKIPGCSLIIAGFRKPFPHENVNLKHVILDPYGGVWTAPRVFDVWHKEIESGALTSDEFSTHQVALVHNRGEFFLAFSDRKSQINNVLHQIQADPNDDEAFPNADSEDKREKRDPDFLPDDED